MQPPQRDTGDRLTTVVTNLTKLAGVVLGLHEGLKTHADPRVIGFAALLVAGVQVIEPILRGIFGGNGKR